MQTYLIMSRFAQKKNKNGKSYGWHIAALETPETKWGRGVVAAAYTEDPSDSWKKIVNRVLENFPEAGDAEIKKMLGIRYPGEAAATSKKSSVPKKNRERKTFRPQELPWPENLMTEIGLENVFTDTGAYRELTPDQLTGLEHAMSTLKEREKDAVLLWFKERKPLRSIGEKYSISRSRVRQIIAKAVRKLGHPSRLVFYRDGYEETLNAKKAEVRKLQDTDRLETIRQMKGISIDAAGFTVRTYNCLRRAGYTNLGDVIEVVDKDLQQIIKLRNFGKRSLLDVIEKLEEYGVDCFKMRVDGQMMVMDSQKTDSSLS